ncbi:MAG TPA: N-6 DNA methylase [Conexibacter sp.]|nr:N-6 DNA methylase [Conexibacter sp.]
MKEVAFDTPALRKARGAFFTPQPIAEYLAEWAVESDPTATVLDPTCGEAVFLEAAARRLKVLGADGERLRSQVLGVDLHDSSVAASQEILRRSGLDGSFVVDDFFALSTPEKLDARLPFVDAIIGNPPFVRYQQHAGLQRKRAQRAALEQGVRLSGLASSWAALVVHACAFLKPEGRLAMVLPTELLTTGYAEEIRLWLKRRFKAVHLVMFERLQFEDAIEKVILVLARGTGGCKALTLVPVEDATDLPKIRMFGPMHLNVAPPDRGKWSDLLLSAEERQAYDRVVDEHFTTLGAYGSPTLGTVTGSNDYFCIDEDTRVAYDIAERHLAKIAPPGARHLRGPRFAKKDWDELRSRNERVWLLLPDGDLDDNDEGLLRYLEEGYADAVHEAYKCRIRTPWYRPPIVPAPDLFFTYMSHRYPRLVHNAAKVSFVNSMHGIRLAKGLPSTVQQALPFLMLNAATMLGAELHGRSYGGGVLKMEPREAADLPIPRPELLETVWRRLAPEQPTLRRQLEAGSWEVVAERIDRELLCGACGLSNEDLSQLHLAVDKLRSDRMGRSEQSV